MAGTIGGKHFKMMFVTITVVIAILTFYYANVRKGILPTHIQSSIEQSLMIVSRSSLSSPENVSNSLHTTQSTTTSLQSQNITTSPSTILPMADSSPPQLQRSPTPASSIPTGNITPPRPQNPLLLVPSDHKEHYINIRSVYLDTRPRIAGHKNASVFLIEVSKDVVKQNLIVGCRVGEHTTTEFKFHTTAITNYIHRLYPKLTHDFAFVDCFDLPAENGSRAFLIYKTSKNSVPVSTESERPFFIPTPHVTPRRGQSFTVASCLAVLFGPHPHFLNEWLHYQRTIGIDHVYIIAEDSFEKAGGFKDPYLKQAIDEGFVSAEVWTQWLASDAQIRYHSQLLAYDDCIYRFIGTYDYVFIVDTDDFFVPRVPGELTIHYYIKNWCQGAGTCQLSWVRYYPDCGLGTTGEDGNVTANLASYLSLEDKVPKSLHKPPTVIDMGPHYPYVSMKGTKVVNMPKTRAYVAHIRSGDKPEKC